MKGYLGQLNHQIIHHEPQRRVHHHKTDGSQSTSNLNWLWASYKHHNTRILEETGKSVESVFSNKKRFIIFKQHVGLKCTHIHACVYVHRERERERENNSYNLFTS